MGLLGQEVAEKDMGSRTRAGWENMPRWKKREAKKLLVRMRTQMELEEDKSLAGGDKEWVGQDNHNQISE